MLQQDEKFMKRCFALAKSSIGYTSPNPMVGAVIVHNGKIIAEAYHRRYGFSHAEPNAINAGITKYGEEKARKLYKESTIYVSLEPCSHYGKTPPCAEKIIEYGFKKVVVSCLDPNPEVSGKGISMLKEAGIEVVSDILEEEGRFFNRRFLSLVEKNRPYVILKWAESADGFIGLNNTGNIAITGKKMQQINHKYRAEEDAILVGGQTLLYDDPSLDNRLFAGKKPIKICIARNMQLPLDLKFFTDNNKSNTSPNILFTYKTNKDYYKSLKSSVNVVYIEDLIDSIDTNTITDIPENYVPAPNMLASTSCNNKAYNNIVHSVCVSNNCDNKTAISKQQLSSNKEDVSSDKKELEAILNYLANEKISSLIVEGGCKLLNSFINSNIWDETRVLTSPIPLRPQYPKMPISFFCPSPNFNQIKRSENMECVGVYYNITAIR